MTKKILGAGLSVFTAAAALQKALGSTPFSVVDASNDSVAYCIALVYTTFGVALGVVSTVYSLKTSSLRLMGYLGAYLLAFASISLINSPANLWMQFANVAAFAGVSLAAFSAWLRHMRERP
ncbi:hypothetical protein [Actinacidiphila sp. ITFR-21]|uniref:hypothetical protein n=1 Tax=Actinacidiphila sp. ITFR-21 TaxID=3075199 RepID=UPI00288AAF35|nr:hypothetical protein [Streptomyces sp. ITFR-21]WNI17575.1 hypothetical protein RLT57_20005 [Streptomyces sp. ITFR-21]WNI17715.1 hypothetical protein RLT57_20720 [Streptomyces sp. ITFR-21]